METAKTHTWITDSKLSRHHHRETVRCKLCGLVKIMPRQVNNSPQYIKSINNGWGVRITPPDIEFAEKMEECYG